MRSLSVVETRTMPDVALGVRSELVRAKIKSSHFSGFQERSTNTLSRQAPLRHARKSRWMRLLERRPVKTLRENRFLGGGYHLKSRCFRGFLLLSRGARPDSGESMTRFLQSESDDFARGRGNVMSQTFLLRDGRQNARWLRRRHSCPRCTRCSLEDLP